MKKLYPMHEGLKQTLSKKLLNHIAGLALQDRGAEELFESERTSLELRNAVDLGAISVPAVPPN